MGLTGKIMVLEIVGGLGVLAALPLRLVVGAAFAVHGYPKLSKRKETGAALMGAGVPPGLTFTVGLLEFFGGIALVLGFLTPVAAGLLALEMIGTTFMVKMKFHKSFVGGYELDLLFLASALTLLLIGAGPVSIDAMLGL